MKRLLLVAAFAVGALLLTTSSVAASGSGSVVYHSSQQLLIAKDRARAAHEAPLYWSSCLARYASRQAHAMAARGTIYHSNISRMFSCRTGNQVGENVGVIRTGGATFTHAFLDSTINNAFMASPHHRANILRHYHYVGTAWAQSASGDWFIAVEFG